MWAVRSAAHVHFLSRLLRTPKAMLDIEELTPTQSLTNRITWHLRYSLGIMRKATPYQRFRAIALALQERLLDRMEESEADYSNRDAKRLYYISLEFLIGRLLRSNLSNLGLLDECREACAYLDLDFDEALDAEPDPALGNGGLGRLAACFLESLASCGLPGYGYGISYEFGLFRQEIRGGQQRERPDRWLSHQSPWTIERSSEHLLVPLYGRIEHGTDRFGQYNPMWMDWRLVVGAPTVIAIAGYGGKTVNALRLFSARASEDFDIDIFNTGDYVRAVGQKMASENISKVLYPSDSIPEGRELRLVQEYFLVACAVRDILTRHLERYGHVDHLHEKVAMQLNDTHPALAVAEWMRVLMDVHGVSWDRAREQTRAICGYTNHTLMPEALEKWPVSLLRHVLPRHLQIIVELNHQFLGDVQSRFPDDPARLDRMSIIEEGAEQQVRMAHLAIIGSHAVNGVSALHSRLVVERLVPDFAEMWPDRFQNKTNGVTHRRWLLETNPPLANLITECIGDGWIRQPEQLAGLAEHAWNTGVQDAFLEAKRLARQRLSHWLRRSHLPWYSEDTLLDVQVKRIHEYKRQLLNILGVIHDYLAILDGSAPATPRVHLIAGKAAPGYALAKLIIRLANAVSTKLAADARARDLLSLIFVPDYKVSVAELVMPAADISEQISTAGMEASGTGNMKLALNGALTLGTLDGANVEIREHVGESNIYIFGLTAEAVIQAQQEHSHHPWQHYQEDAGLRRVLDTLRSDMWSPGHAGTFEPLFHRLLEGGDPYFHLADFRSYLDARRKIESDFLEPRLWAQRALLNVAGVGYFSSDRTVREYARDIWDLEQPAAHPTVEGLDQVETTRR
jgi:starch phosphorylase